MKKWIACVLCLVMLLISVSALAALEALPAPDASLKPDMVSVSVKKDVNGYLLLTVSDGRSDYQVQGNPYTFDGEYYGWWDSVTFEWDAARKAYVSDVADSEFTGRMMYTYLDRNTTDETVYLNYVLEDPAYGILESDEPSSTHVTRWVYTANGGASSTWYVDGRSEVFQYVLKYDSQDKVTYETQKRATYDKDGLLTDAELSNMTFQDDKFVTNHFVSESYSPINGAVISKYTLSEEFDENQKSSYEMINESFTRDGALTGRNVDTLDVKTRTETKSREYYYDDGSLRYKTFDKEVTSGDTVYVSGERYNSRNELVYSMSGTKTYDNKNEDAHIDTVYTDASGAKIGWQYFDPDTGKEDSRLPDTYWGGGYNEINFAINYETSDYARSGDVETWREYSYDPDTEIQKMQITNYKGLKLYEMEFEGNPRETLNGTSTYYWLRSQTPYLVTTYGDDKNEFSYVDTRGMEWQKFISENGGTESYYNSLGELTYKYVDGKYYVNQDGKLQELEDGLTVWTGNRYNVIGFRKDEESGDNYKITYYDLDKKVSEIYESTYTTSGNININTATDTFFDTDGTVLDKYVTVTKTEETENGRWESETTNGILTYESEYVTNNGDSLEASWTYNQETGILESRREAVSIKGEPSRVTTWEYDTEGNLYSVRKQTTQANGFNFQTLDGNYALESSGTERIQNGHTIYTENWAVGTLRATSDWYMDGLKMPDVWQTGTYASYAENGDYTYWYSIDADGNTSTWEYYPQGGIVSSITEINYNADGSKSDHTQYFKKDGTTDYWWWWDASEDAQYVTQRYWSGDGTLQWTSVSEATKEGKTETRTDPSGNRVVTKYDMQDNEISKEASYTATDGWLYAFGNWVYLEDGEAVEGWKNLGGAWYYLVGNDGITTINAFIDGVNVYAFNEDGMWCNEPGWARTRGGNWSYIKADGTAATGWQQIDGQWYYFDEGGYLLTGNVTVDGYTYHLNDDGVWITLSGWYENPSTGFYNHYTNDVLDTGWFYDGGWHYLSGGTGSMLSDTWLELDDDWYLFDENGVMASGWTEKNGAWYYFEDNGALADGWMQSGDTWYYMTESGMATGWVAVDGNWEYFNADGSWSYTWGPVEE